MRSGGKWCTLVSFFGLLTPAITANHPVNRLVGSMAFAGLSRTSRRSLVRCPRPAPPRLVRRTSLGSSCVSRINDRSTVFRCELAPVRSLLDRLDDLPNATTVQVELCTEAIEWSRADKRAFLRQSLETRLVGLYGVTGRRRERGAAPVCSDDHLPALSPGVSLVAAACKLSSTPRPSRSSTRSCVS